MLVPKFSGAKKISDFCPISCLNTVYKVISRLLVARLKPIIQDVILPCQTNFVKDRLLVENTVLASELVHGYHKNKGPKRITIKVDIAKAFDMLSWEFLFSCLDSMQIPHHFLSQLKACICTTSFMVWYNGTVNGYFKGRRGLRQGDPLSPYLSVIAMNCLSFMLKKSGNTIQPTGLAIQLYWLWNERNSRLHTNSFRSIDSLFRIIDRQIRNRIQSFRSSNPKLASSMLQSWFRHAWLILLSPLLHQRNLRRLILSRRLILQLGQSNGLRVLGPSYWVLL